jgi:hypothetical protein
MIEPVSLNLVYSLVRSSRSSDAYAKYMKQKGLQTKHALKEMRTERKKVGYNLFK